MPKTSLARKKKEIDAEKIEMRDLLADYDIDPESVSSVNALAQINKTLFSFISSTVIPATGHRAFGSYIGYSLEDGLQGMDESIALSFSADVLMNVPDIIASVVAPVERQIATGIRPSKNQILTMVSLRNILDFAYANVYTQHNNADILRNLNPNEE